MSNEVPESIPLTSVVVSAATTPTASFGDESLVSEIRSLIQQIEALPPSVHATRLHQLTYDTLIALMSLQQTGDYVWPQPQFQPLKEAPPEDASASSLDDLNTIMEFAKASGAWEQLDAGYVGFASWASLKNFAEKLMRQAPVVSVASEIIDAHGTVLEEVPTLATLALRFWQAMVEAGVTFPDTLTAFEKNAIEQNLQAFLKDPGVNTNEPFLIPDPNDPDHLLKVTFEGFNIRVESTLPLRKPDQPLTPVEVMSNPINTLPIMAFFTMAELVVPPEGEFARMDQYNAAYPKANKPTPSIFDAAVIPRDKDGNPRRRSTDVIGSMTL